MPTEIHTEHRYYCGTHSGASPWYDTKQEAQVFALSHRASHHGGLTPDDERFEKREVEVEVEEPEPPAKSGGSGSNFPPGVVIGIILLLLLISQCGGK